MRAVVAASFLMFASGCLNQPDQSRYYPPEVQARQALESALIAWQRGVPAGQIPGSASPTLMFSDTHRTPNQTLKSFSILGMAPGDGPRVFTVKLILEKPVAEQKVRFVVFGIDPIWVVRHEDYEMLTHWDHPMKNPNEK